MILEHKSFITDSILCVLSVLLESYLSFWSMFSIWFQALLSLPLCVSHHPSFPSLFFIFIQIEILTFVVKWIVCNTFISLVYFQFKSLHVEWVFMFFYVTTFLLSQENEWNPLLCFWCHKKILAFKEIKIPTLEKIDSLTQTKL